MEDAAIVIEEDGYEIAKFLDLHHQGLGYREEECNRMMGILDDYINLMAGCVSLPTIHFLPEFKL